MKKIYTAGTFDCLHWGHINLLRRSKRLGDLLLVSLSTDEFNAIKGKKAYQKWQERADNLMATKYVDWIVKEESWEQKLEDIKKFDIDVFVIGDDWKGKFDDLPCEVVYLPRTKNISSTQIRGLLNNI